MYEDIVCLVFRIINLGIFVGLAAFLFKRKIIPIIYKNISEQKNERNSLDVQYISLEKKLRAIKMEIDGQDRDSIDVEAKIKIWNKTFEDKQKLEFEEKNRVLKKMVARIKKQQEFLNMYSVRQNILPQALFEAEKDLNVQFVDEKKQKKFVGLVCNIIAKRA
ncbi:hypothetical protein HN446_02930 [bacterium]|nr:hypothetical protein [bacterium]